MDFLDEESDSESESYKLFGGKEGIVFLVDTTEQMFDCQQFSLAIQCVQNVMKNKAISSPSDELSLIFFGTDLTSNDDSFDHIFIVEKLQKVTADSILGLKDLTECDFRSKFGHNSHYSLADVFSTAISEFTKSKSRFETKRVILFTSCCEPHSGNTPEDKHLRKTAINRAKDFKDHSIEVELIPLASKDDKVFDFEVFYQDVFPDLKDDKSHTLTKLEPLLRRIHSKSYKQRMLAAIPFRLGPWGQHNQNVPEVKMSVYLYSMYSEAKKPTALKINRKNLKEVKSETQRWTQDCGAIVTNEELSKKYKFGTESIFLNKTDLKSIKTIEEPALTLLGFKDRTAINSLLHIKPGHFIYPNESSINGSTTLFNALLKRCTERDKIAICRLTIRRSAQTHLVALFPQIEIKALDQFGGFNVLYLPYKEDIRELNIKGAEKTEIKAEAIELAKSIVTKLSFKYDPKDFPNPALQTHWRAIEALALNYDNFEPFDDSQTQPDYNTIETKAGYDLFSLTQSLGGHLVQSTEKKTQVFNDLKEMTNNNKLGTLTVAELKEFCRLKDIKSGTKKDEYIEAIRKYYGVNAKTTAEVVKDNSDLRELAINNKLGSLTVPELQMFCETNDIKSGSKKIQLIESIRNYYEIQ